MPDLFGISTSALLAFQKGIAVTGHNIANASTEGYSRQDVVFESAPGQRIGDHSIGNGVRAGTNTRAYNKYLTEDVRSTGSSKAQFEIAEQMSTRLIQLVGDSESGLAARTASFFNSVEDLTNNPTSVAGRQVVLGEADFLTAQFRTLSSQLDQLEDQVNLELDVVLGEINDQLSSIAAINSAVSDTSGNVSGDLLDKRDILINQVSERIGLLVSTQDNGVVNLALKNGLPIVTGISAGSLSSQRGEFDISETTINLTFPGTGEKDITSATGNGRLQGLINFRDGLLHDTQQRIGLMAAGLSETVNAQHQRGLDLNGDFGKAFFTPTQIQVLSSLNNTGTASVTASITDIGNLNATDFSLAFNGTEWQLSNSSSGASVNGTGPLTLDGISVSISGSAVAGDRYEVRPTFTAASQMSVNISNTSEIASRAPLISSTSAANSGTSEISAATVSTSASLPLTSDLTFTFNENALGVGVPGFTVTGATVDPIAFNPTVDGAGKTVDLTAIMGGTFTISGVPSEGDTLVLSNNVAGVGDNRNLQTLSGLSTSKTLLEGSTSFSDVFASAVAEVGIQTRQATMSHETQTSLHEYAMNNQQSNAGVNLDEEAAKLLQYQQAYQAAARVIAASDEMFQTLLGAFRR
jgi:flagellar hook-associated protein 1